MAGRDTLNLDGLRTFLAVADLSSFTAAGAIRA